MTVYYAKDKKGVPTADGGVSVGGVFYTHDFKQLGFQAIAALAVIAWNIVATFIVLKIVSFIVPLRASEGDIEGGDLAIHGIDPMPVYLTPTTNGTPVKPSAPVG
jgi:ammonia channel protein AmtB